ncbi:MAG: SpvB/TcaC N-terminal domain-containing protein, partial [Bacteroidota bacterium]
MDSPSYAMNEQRPNEVSFNQNDQSQSAISSFTQERATESNAIEIPEIALPKGGGALKGIDEKFEVNAANGTAAFSIPLPLSAGRNGFSPSLSLSYNSGGGNSPFGLGWLVDFPSIQRRTDRQLPRYRDGLEEDVFLFSGAEDLVPYLEKNTQDEWVEKLTVVGAYKIKRYRPRVEGGFARIEKITHPNHGIYWKVTTRENIATIFGRSPATRIADPKVAEKIFQWLPEFSYDDKGNWIQYEYKTEDLKNVPNLLHEKNRLKGIASFTNQYLKRIRYGNQKAYYADPNLAYDPQNPTDESHFFEVIFDYGEHSNAQFPHLANEDWQYRSDAFSNYRSGFEIRTQRLCQRVLMFHHFKAEKQFVGTNEEEAFGENYLVRSLDFNYQPSSINQSGQAEVTYLQSITQSGYIRKPDGSYSKKSLPPMEFEYEQLNWNTEVKTVSPENIINAPVGLTNNYQWIDLYNEGISGILTEQGEAWYYKSNLGDTDEDGEVAFSVAKAVIPKPSLTGLSN